MAKVAGSDGAVIEYAYDPPEARILKDLLPTSHSVAHVIHLDENDSVPDTTLERFKENYLAPKWLHQPHVVVLCSKNLPGTPKRPSAAMMWDAFETRTQSFVQHLVVGAAIWMLALTEDHLMADINKLVRSYKQLEKSSKALRGDLKLKEALFVERQVAATGRMSTADELINRQVLDRTPPSVRNRWATQNCFASGTVLMPFSLQKLRTYLVLSDSAFTTGMRLTVRHFDSDVVQSAMNSNNLLRRETSADAELVVRIVGSTADIQPVDPLQPLTFYFVLLLQQEELHMAEMRASVMQRHPGVGFELCTLASKLDGRKDILAAVMHCALRNARMHYAASVFDSVLPLHGTEADLDNRIHKSLLAILEAKMVDLKGLEDLEPLEV